jgi:hypothetical protein
MKRMKVLYKIKANADHTQDGNLGRDQKTTIKSGHGIATIVFTAPHPLRLHRSNSPCPLLRMDRHPAASTNSSDRPWRLEGEDGNTRRRLGRTCGWGTEGGIGIRIIELGKIVYVCCARTGEGLRRFPRIVVGTGNKAPSSSRNSGWVVVR